MISHKHKYIFVHIPKCGGSSTELSLLEAEGVDCSDANEINQLPEDILSTYFMNNDLAMEPQHYTLEEYPEYFQKEYFCFTIIRNPWEIWVSEYHHELRVRKRLGRPKVTFEEFIRKNKGFKYHLRSQMDFINQNMDYVGRMESIDSDFMEICDKLGIDAQLKHRNKGKYENHYSEYYNEGILSLINSHNSLLGSTGKLDAQLMGYESNPGNPKSENEENPHEATMDNVFFINLDSREDRKELVENELNELNWSYERFPGTKTSDGRIGATISHIGALELAAARDLDYAVILEDDIHFRDKALFLRQLKKCLKEINDFDVLLLGGQIGPKDERITEYAFKLKHCVTATGYIVNKHYYKRFLEHSKKGLNLLIENPSGIRSQNQYAFDIYWWELQERDKWYMVAPACVEQRDGFSDIREQYTDHRKLFTTAWKEKSHLINTKGYC